MARTDAQCNVGISKHILDQECTYLFEHNDKVYVISKQLILDVFGVCVNGYVKEPKGHVSKSQVVHALQSYKLALANSSTNQWNTKSLGLPYSVKYPTIMSIIYQKEKVQYFNNKNAITIMRAKKGQKVDWAQIIFNSLCSELDMWYKYVKENKGDKKDTCQSAWCWQRSFSFLFMLQTENPHKSPTKVKIIKEEMQTTLENRKKATTNSPRSAFKRKNKVEEGGASHWGVKREHESTNLRAHKMMRGRVEPSIVPTMVRALV